MRRKHEHDGLEKSDIALAVVRHVITPVHTRETRCKRKMRMPAISQSGRERPVRLANARQQQLRPSTTMRLAAPTPPLTLAARAAKALEITRDVEDATIHAHKRDKWKTQVALRVDPDDQWIQRAMSPNVGHSP